jgi:hypothetical protein
MRFRTLILAILLTLGTGCHQGGDPVAGPPEFPARYIAFQSDATNLVSGDTNAFSDIFVHDRQTGATTRVSVATNGGQGNADSFSPAISSDGRFVAFSSNATNLVPGVAGGTDVLVHDRQTGITTRAARASSGTPANAGSFDPSISSDGRFVAFESFATNLVAGGTNTVGVYVHDRQTAVTTRVSVASDGTEGNASSDFSSVTSDGRFVAFVSGATNLVAGDTNGFVADVFVHDRQTGATTRVSVASDGTQGNGDSSVVIPRISSDGRFVAFASLATNLVAGDTNAVADVFVHDRQTGATTRVSVASDGSQANGASGIFFPSLSMSSDGRFVGFDSDATNLVSGDTNAATDVFVHDRQTGATARVSMDSAGIQGNNIAAVPSLSPDGRFVGFDSDATNLVSGDSNGASDVFVHDRQTGATIRVSVAGDGAQANGNSFNASAAGP